MGRAKELVKACLPDSLVKKISAVRMAAWRQKWRNMGHEFRFNYIHGENRWGDEESVSGFGSTLRATQQIRKALPDLLADLGVKTLLDVPCGDFHWMKELNLSVDYIGVDVVRQLVEANGRKHAAPGRRFMHLDITKDPLPRADAVFCRECLVHFCYSDLCKALKNIAASGSKYLITTTYPDRETNHDIETGDWRTLNLEKAPFNWPAPIRIVNDAATQDDNDPYRDKSMGVWRIADITGTSAEANKR